MTKLDAYMSKATIVGIAILEISKCMMYEFHYDFIRKHFDHNECKIIYTDTDSFLYEFKDVKNRNIDPYEFIRNNNSEFDTSDFAENNQFKIKRLNKKVVGKMKDELNGQIINEFIGLRSKMYTMRIFNHDKVVKRAKGVKKCVLNNKITFADYKNCIENLCQMTEKQSCMRSDKHTVFNITNDKKVLDPFDDKRYLIPDSHSTWAWGHKNIR